MKIVINVAYDEAISVAYALSRESKAFASAAQTPTEGVDLELVTQWLCNASLLERMARAFTEQALVGR